MENWVLPKPIFHIIIYTLLRINFILNKIDARK